MDEVIIFFIKLGLYQSLTARGEISKYRVNIFLEQKLEVDDRFFEYCQQTNLKHLENYINYAIRYQLTIA